MIFMNVADFKTGDSFGEISLLENKLRTATIIANETTYLLILDKQHFNDILAAVHLGCVNRKYDFLRSLSAFDGWSKLALRRISYHFEEKTYKKG